jgi:hypothetical protein
VDAEHGVAECEVCSDGAIYMWCGLCVALRLPREFDARRRMLGRADWEVRRGEGDVSIEQAGVYRLVSRQKPGRYSGYPPVP